MAHSASVRARALALVLEGGLHFRQAAERLAVELGDGAPHARTIARWVDAEIGAGRAVLPPWVYRRRGEAVVEEAMGMLRAGCPVSEVVETMGVSDGSVRRWAHERGVEVIVSCRCGGCRGVRRGDGGRACGVDAAGMDEAQLRAALARERAENERLRLENDVMREAMDVLKSPCPLPLAGVAGRLERTMVVERLRDRWPLKALLEAVGLNRKSYYYHRRGERRLARQRLEVRVRQRVLELFEATGRVWGYRRIHALLAREGVRISEKRVRCSSCASRIWCPSTWRPRAVTRPTEAR